MPAAEMRETRRRVLQGVCSVCVCVYLGAVIGRGAAKAASSQTDADSAPAWPDRAPMSVDYSEETEQALETESRPSPRFAYLVEAGATTTPPPERRQPTALESVFISVKTSGQFHESRLKPLLDTWVPHVQQQVGGRRVAHVAHVARRTDPVQRPCHASGGLPRLIPRWNLRLITTRTCVIYHRWAIYHFTYHQYIVQIYRAFIRCEFGLVSPEYLSQVLLLF